MRINLKMTYEELVKMQNSVAELPFMLQDINLFEDCHY